MFKLEQKDLHGIERWYEWYQKWSRNPVRKYTKEEEDKLRKKLKVGKYRTWTLSEERFNEISKGIRNTKIDKIRRTKMIDWVTENHPEHLDLSTEEWVKMGYHREIFGKYSVKSIDQEERFLNLEE